MKQDTTPGLGFPGRLTDAQWLALEPILDESRRKRKHPLRQVTESILYVLEQGCKWRALPGRLKWQLAYYYFRAWKKDGTILKLSTHLLPRVRKAQGRSSALPSAAIIDTQSVKTKHGGQRLGKDPNKKVSGRKRLILTDTEGNLLLSLVQGASEHDSAHVGALLWLAKRQGLASRLSIVFADLAFRKRGQRQAKEQGIDLVIESRERKRRTPSQMAAGAKKYPRPEPQAGEGKPKRWVVERTFAWLGNYRRLGRDYEKTTSSSVAWIMLAASTMAILKI